MALPVDSPASTPHDSHIARRKAGVFSLLRNPRALWRFLRDRNAPVLPRIVALLTVAYVVMPLDLIPDAIPFLGWLDDLGFFAAALAWVASQAARYENNTPGLLTEPQAPTGELPQTRS